MPRLGKITRPGHITVQAFLENHGADLKLSVEHPLVGLDRLISEPAVNRPGLALAGFTTYFAKKRIQVFGNAEMSYLKKISKSQREARFRKLCEQDFPCLVLAREHRLQPELLKIAAEQEIPVVTTGSATWDFLNRATIHLEKEFAPKTSLHGCMVDYRGVGVLVMGKSGSGKSETAIGLLEKGAALVADDYVRVKRVGDELITSGRLESLRGFLEMRGIGIINVSNLFGLNAIRAEKRLDLVVELNPSASLNSFERTGLQPKEFEILDKNIPLIEIPVAPGRDTARLVAVAALATQFKALGYDMADEFNKRQLKALS